MKIGDISTLKEGNLNHKRIRDFDFLGIKLPNSRLGLKLGADFVFLLSQQKEEEPSSKFKRRK